MTAKAKPKTKPKAKPKTAKSAAKATKAKSAPKATKTKSAPKATKTKTAPKTKPSMTGGASDKNKARIFAMPFASVYPMYVQKAEKKGRTKDELDQVITWLTGYSDAELRNALDTKVDFATFYTNAPKMNPNASLITGVVCGVRVQDIDDPLMKQIRYLDKLVDELAQGKAMEKILRA